MRWQAAFQKSQGIKCIHYYICRAYFLAALLTLCTATDFAILVFRAAKVKRKFIPIYLFCDSIKNIAIMDDLRGDVTM